MISKIGDLEYAKGNSDAAIGSYEKALENSIKLHDYDATYHLYHQLSDLYIDNGINIKQARTYLKKAKETKLKLDQSNQNAIDIAIRTILKNKEEKEANLTVPVIFGSCTATGLIVYLIAFNYHKRRTKNSFSLTTKTTSYTEDEVPNSLSKQKEDEEKFTTLVNLAKSNNPEFLVLFSELYPEFISFIKTMDPKVRSSELSFLAMTYLNFSTKDISEYTYITVRAVQVRKNRLRKKYTIPSDEDFNSWMQGKRQINHLSTNANEATISSIIKENQELV